MNYSIILNQFPSVSHYYSILFEACIPKTFSPVRIERFRKEVFHEKLQVQRAHQISEKIFAKRLEHIALLLRKEKREETFYLEMNTTPRFKC